MTRWLLVMLLFSAILFGAKLAGGEVEHFGVRLAWFFLGVEVGRERPFKRRAKVDAS